MLDTRPICGTRMVKVSELGDGAINWAHGMGLTGLIDNRVLLVDKLL